MEGHDPTPLRCREYRLATFSVDDLAQHAGTDVERLEELSRGVLLGNGLLFESRSHRKRRGGIREIVKPNPWLDSITKSLNRSFFASVAILATGSCSWFRAQSFYDYQRHCTLG